MASFNVSQFRALVSRVKQANHPDVRIGLSRLMQEARERMREPSSTSTEFFTALREALHQLRGVGNAEARISCLMDCAHYFYLAGDVLQGIPAARDAVRLAKTLDDRSHLRKSYTLLGILLSDCGLIAESVEAETAAIELAKQIQDHGGQIISLLNLGISFTYAAQFQDGLACLRRGEELAAQYGAPAPWLPSMYTNRALCLLRQHRIQEGLKAAKQSIECSSEPSSLAELHARVVREFILLQLILESRNGALASQCLRRLKTYADRTDTARTKILAKISDGLVEIFRGDADRGLTLLTEAESYKFDDTVHDDALIALIRAYEELGRYEDALRNLHSYMEKVRRKATDLAAHQFTAAHSSTALQSPNEGLRELEHREALLRAKVAEDRLAWSQIEMLERLAVTADLREEASGEHGYRVGRLAAALAEDLGWSSESCLSIDLAARLHDIGKMAVPDRILLTSEALKEAERRFMSRHTVFGAELLAKSNIPQLKMAQDIALYHHEWWDGSGYPKKLAGKRIPVHARIVAIADVFDALTHGRPYSEPWSMDRAIEEIRSRSGTQFDPELTDRFLVLIARLRAEHENLDEFLARASRHSPFLQARRKIKLMLEQERAEDVKPTVPGNRTRH